MRRLAARLGVLLLLMVGCGAPGAERPAGSRPQADLVAEPNPVPADGGDLGETRITWSTGDGSSGQVFVSRDGEAETLFAAAPEGSQVAPWIASGARYDFRLYGPGGRGDLLASVSVARASKPLDLAPWMLVASAVAAILLARLGALGESGRRRRPWRFALAAVAGLAVATATGRVLSVTPRPLEEQPFPDSAEYADGARQIADGRGYVTLLYGEPRPGRYPPGYSLALAPFAAFGGSYPDGVQTGAKALAALYPLAAGAAGWALGGPVAAAVGAALVGTSPFATRMGGLVLSDAFLATSTLVLLPLVSRPGPRRVALAGLVAGCSIGVRWTGGLTLLALALALPRRTWPRLLAFAAPGVVSVAIFHLASAGGQYLERGAGRIALGKAFQAPPVGADGPWVAGDALGGALMQWVCPCPAGGPEAALSNVAFYPLVLLGIFWVFTPPLCTVPGLLYAWRRRASPFAAFALWLAIATVGLLFLFEYQANRYLAPPVSVLIVLTGVAVARWAERRPSPSPLVAGSGSESAEPSRARPPTGGRRAFEPRD